MSQPLTTKRGDIVSVHIGGFGDAGPVSATASLHLPTGRFVADWISEDQVVLGETADELRARGYSITHYDRGAAMNQAEFSHNLSGATELQRTAIGAEIGFWQGYARGLRRSFHGVAFGTAAEHDLWLSLRDARGAGYEAGYRALSVREAIGLPPKGWQSDRVDSLVPGVLR